MDFALFGIVFSVIAGLLIFITLGCEGMYDYWKNEMPRKDKLKIRNSFMVAVS